jgi:hypothetical protein
MYSYNSFLHNSERHAVSYQEVAWTADLSHNSHSLNWKLTSFTSLNYHFSSGTSELHHSTENYHLKSHAHVFFNYEPPAAVSHRELLVNELQSLL